MWDKFKFWCYRLWFKVPTKQHRLETSQAEEQLNEDAEELEKLGVPRNFTLYVISKNPSPQPYNVLQIWKRLEASGVDYPGKVVKPKKKLKDMTVEERREYSRAASQRHREKYPERQKAARHNVKEVSKDEIVAALKKARNTP